METPVSSPEKKPDSPVTGVSVAELAIRRQAFTKLINDRFFRGIPVNVQLPPESKADDVKTEAQ